MDKPLKGKKIMVTRDPAQAGSLIDKLTLLGSQVLPFPTIRIVPPDDWAPCDQTISELPTFDWIVFTSSNGVNYFMKRLRETTSEKITASVAVVGKKTADVLNNYDHKADLIPENYNARGLLNAFENIDLKNKKILIPTSSIGKKTLKEGLSRKGAEVVQISCYQTRPFSGHTEMLQDRLNKKDIDCITFFSPSSFKSFLSLSGDVLLNNEPEQLPALAAIGPTTATAIREKGLRVNILPEQSVEDSMIEAIIDYFNKN